MTTREKGSLTHENEENDNTISLKNKLFDAKEKLIGVYEENSAKYKAKALRTNECVTSYVKDNPWKALGIGITIGIVINKLFSIKRK